MKNKKSPSRIILLLNFMAIVIMNFSGCAFVRDAPQKDTVYVPVEMKGQVPKAKTGELSKKYPPGFWKQKPVNIADNDQLTIGIKEFLTITRQVNPTTDLGRMVTEIFSTALVQSEAFNLIERQQLESVLNEFELNQSGIIDPNTAAEVGRISGVEVIITGSISQIGGNRRIDARAIEVSTGKAVIADTLTPVFNSQNVNLRPVDARNIQSFAKRFVSRLMDKYYR